MELLGNKRLVTYLLFRGTDHGWTYEDFHDRCDSKGPTICLFKLKDGDLIGGYTTSSWLSLFPGKYAGDSDAILFNLSCSRAFPSKRTGKDIYSSRGSGPCFDGGGSDSELGASEPFNGNEKCCSVGQKSSFDIPINDGINMLTNQNDGSFTIIELEVWEVKQ
jgi:hypothetical protein